MSQKEKFAPLIRWVNKNSTPDFETTLNYHTSDMLGFISEFVQENNISSSVAAPSTTRPENVSFTVKRRRIEGNTVEVVDLTDDNNAGDDDLPADNNDEEVEERIDDEICILPRKLKEVPLLDLADEENDSGRSAGANWSSMTVRV